MFSERALNEIKTNTCSTCLTPYTEQDIVILNGSDEDVDLMTTRMDARVARLKAEKKEKKNKSKTEETATTAGPSKSNGTNPKMPFTFKPTLPASKRELILDPFADQNAKKVKKDYSVAADPKCTSVYKSLFTSHESEKNQERAHWVTYNPHYN